MQEGIHLGGKWGRFVRDKFLVLTTFTNHFTLRLILRFYIHIIEEMSITHMQSFENNALSWLCGLNKHRGIYMYMKNQQRNKQPTSNNMIHDVCK